MINVSYCIFFFYSLIVFFVFDQQVTKEWSLSWRNLKFKKKKKGRYKNIYLKKMIKGVEIIF